MFGYGLGVVVEFFLVKFVEGYKVYLNKELYEK